MTIFSHVVILSGDLRNILVGFQNLTSTQKLYINSVSRRCHSMRIIG